MLGGILDDLLTSPSTGPCITATVTFPRGPRSSFRFRRRSIHESATRSRARRRQLYSHQARAFETVAKGENVVVVTPTASGKTLCYNLPVLQALVQQPDARASICSRPRRWPRISSPS